MLSQADATIYLANQRGCSQEEWHRSYHTFNFGSYFNESRKSFANLQVVNDDALKGGSTITFDVKENTLILLLPLVGAFDFQNQYEQGSVEVGQCYHFFATKNSSFEIINPYESELINFLQIWLTTESPKHLTATHKIDFDLNLHKNQLIALSSTGINKNAIAFIGKFDGRQEGIISIQHPDKGAFVFIIEGAFEVQNRLLQPRDGLAIWNTSEIEFEALSNDAIILIVELIDFALPLGPE